MEEGKETKAKQPSETVSDNSLTNKNQTHITGNQKLKQLSEVLEADRDIDEMTAIVHRSFQATQISPFVPEIAEKISPEHISAYLENTKEVAIKSFQMERDNKIFIFSIVFILLVFFVLLVILLKDNSPLLEKIFYIAVGLVPGVLGGYGIGISKKSDN